MGKVYLESCEIVIMSLFRFTRKNENAPGLRSLLHYLLGISLALLSWSPSLAAEEIDLERLNSIKAAFVLNISRFVTWPVADDVQEGTPMVVCVYQNNPFGEGLDSIDGKKVSGRPLNIASVDSLDERQDCGIMLIGREELADFQADAHPGLNTPILTIADLTATEISEVGFKDVMVSLIRQGSRIGFEINLRKAESLGFKLSSELLKLANIVDEGA